MFLSLVAIIGLSGIVAQVILLRELMVGFQGNEMTVGVIFANWLAGEALGAYLSARIIERARNKILVFMSAEWLFLAALPVCLFFARVYKSYAGIPVGEGMGFTAIMLVTLAACLPVSFLHGALFSASCGLRPDQGIGKIYAWETIGTIAGGLLLTYALLPSLTSFDSVVLLTAANLIACVWYLSFGRARFAAWRNLCAAGLLLLCLGSMTDIAGQLQRRSILTQFRQGKVLAYRNSVYGNLAVTRTEGQYTFFSNGVPVITTPVPDSAFVEDFAHIPLAFHPLPADIFVAGGGAGGLLDAILKHPVASVHYTEIDPLLIDMVRMFPTALTRREFSDPRLRVTGRDPRYVLQHDAATLYDGIIIGVSHVSDLASNRLFTEEFFSLARSRLRAQGILCFWMSGSLSYLSEELGVLNAGVLNSLHAVFPFIRVIPGDYTIYIASMSPSVAGVTPGVIVDRLAERGIETQVISRPYLEHRFDPESLEWFAKNVSIDTVTRNSDLRPVSVFHTLLLWNKRFSRRVVPVLTFVRSFPAVFFFMVVSLVLIVPSVFPRRQDGRQRAIARSIAATGFMGMTANLMLIFCYQISCGYLYYRIGLLIALFMAGTAAGSIAVSGRFAVRCCRPGVFLVLEMMSALFPFVLWFIIPRVMDSLSAPLVFGACFFFCGALIGLAFSLGAALYLKEEGACARTAGALYFADLFGGWAAGIVSGLAGVALAGVQGMCVVMIVLKAASCALFARAYTKGPSHG